MPLPTSKLTKHSSKKTIDAAVSKTIKQLMKEKRSQKQSIAIALEDARKHGAKVQLGETKWDTFMRGGQCGMKKKADQ